MWRHGRPAEVRNWQEKPVSVVMRGGETSKPDDNPKSASSAAAMISFAEGDGSEEVPVSVRVMEYVPGISVSTAL